MKICFIDTIGLIYDGSTLSKKGLGGSESAIIMMAKELAKIGFDVTVYNSCTDDDANAGIYDNVKYRPMLDLSLKDEIYDIVVSSRTITPFIPKQHYDWGINELKCKYNPELYSYIIKNTKLKILWLHDTFCIGDYLLEDYVLNGHIDYIFTLSDFHTSYVTNCVHGKRRMFEVLKRHIFQTRNGIILYKDFIDINSKDPNLFVYNASYTKGMRCLVADIWGQIKRAIPSAKLIIIGGYYKFKNNTSPDQQEVDVVKLKNAYQNKNLDITFTGIISQKEISDILEKASYFIYPTAFPETFGISTLEALAHNVTPITTNFGALEETAIDIASYKIPYAIEPNDLYPEINYEDQCNRFINMTINAYNDKYLHQQKQYACNVVKDICTWDTVAIEWKQFFYHELKLNLSLEEFKRVKYIKEKVRKIFKRRFINEVDYNG